LRRRIINVGAGSQDTDAVNVAQLRAVEDLANRKVTLAGDIGGNVQKSLGDTLTIKGGEAVESSLANGANIGVVKENDGLKVKLAKNLSDLTSVSATTKITVGNTNNNNAELQNGGLTLTSTTSASTEKTVYGVDGLKFNANNGAAIKDTTRITKDKIGFADASGVVDKESPYLDKKQLKVGK
ncbi:hypothetical protein D6E02_09270, partial [Moraxella catarrhalis]